ncbi:hypothetical protein RJ640_024430 [Escallonia rubra]|uniref:Chalcone/stilbene synthase N-terminal domain-containing protein n=1 Tax=Escallonia rubra TaxID=112253 RepID=A0AA88RMD0_9ASTE|nr:hypothetical protein RJ640_024430 [Escallonia rubra]
MPGADYKLTKLLGLRPSVKRLMMYQQGCFAGGTVPRLAKDLAENNAGACVFVVCFEIIAVTFRGPSDTHLDSLAGQALFGDGAATVIISKLKIVDYFYKHFNLYVTFSGDFPLRCQII